MKQLTDLAVALDALLAAAVAAHGDLPNEDTATVAAQAQKAVQLADDLRAALGSTEQSLHILHGLNNKLTGAMSLTMLAREDLLEPHATRTVDATRALDAVLGQVEQGARAAAEAVRLVAMAVKGG